MNISLKESAEFTIAQMAVRSNISECMLLVDRFSKIYHNIFHTVSYTHLDTEIVRGLDYYTKTVFEFVNEDGFTLCGGGRYDNLVNEIDGKVSMPSVGFGMGVERILYLLEEEKVDLPCTRDIDLYVGILGQEAKAKA